MLYAGCLWRWDQRPGGYETGLWLGDRKDRDQQLCGREPFFHPCSCRQVGGQSVIVSIDARRKAAGRYDVYTHGGRRSTGLEPAQFAAQMEEMGAGEILLTSMDRDGTQQGYDAELLKQVTGVVGIPVMRAAGGQGGRFRDSVRQGGASACAAGSMVVYLAATGQYSSISRAEESLKRYWGETEHKHEYKMRTLPI